MVEEYQAFKGGVLKIVLRKSLEEILLVHGLSQFHKIAKEMRQSAHVARSKMLLLRKLYIICYKKQA